MINVALPKGRLGETAYETLAAAGIGASNTSSAQDVLARLQRQQGA